MEKQNQIPIYITPLLEDDLLKMTIPEKSVTLNFIQDHCRTCFILMRGLRLNRLHVYRRRLLDICVKHQAGMILLVNQEEKEERAKEDIFLLRNWSFGELKMRIEYKAIKHGINIISVKI